MRRSSLWMMIICVLFVPFSGFGQFVICSEEKGTYNDIKNNVVKMKLGGVSDSLNNGAEIDEIALFAVQEHNRREVLVSSNLISHFFSVFFGIRVRIVLCYSKITLPIASPFR